MRFSSSSRALAFLKSAMNCTSPRMLELLLLERPRKPPAAEDAMVERFAVSGRTAWGKRTRRCNQTDESNTTDSFREVCSETGPRHGGGREQG